MKFSKYIDNYINAVANGEIIVPKSIHQAIELIEDTLNKPNVVIKHEMIETAKEKIEEYFPYKLFDWELFLLGLIHCFYDDDTLVWDQFLLMMGRGAGKNGVISPISWYLTTSFHGIDGYNVDIVANSEDQAKTSFNDVYDVIDNSSKLKKAFSMTKEKIVFKKTKSYIRYRTSNARTKDGLRPGAVIFDEIHEYDNYDNIKVFRSAFGKVKHTRTFYITTQGYVRGGVLDDFLETADQILKREIKNSKLLPLLYKLDHEDEVKDENLWPKANPSYIYNDVLRTQMQQEFKEMQHQQYLAIEFKTKRMNLPAEQAYYTVATWEKIKMTNREVPDLNGATCIGAIDYASIRDFASVGLLFRKGEEYIFIQHTFICHLALKLENRTFKFDIDQARENGLCTVVREDSIQESYIVNWFLEKAKTYNIKTIVTDSYRKSLLSAAFAQAGLELSEVRNGTITHTKIHPLIEKIFADEQVIFGDDMMMRWYTNNVYVDTDPKGNKTFKKIEPILRKTDGFFAFVHAMSKHEELPVEQSYDFFDMTVW